MKIIHTADLHLDSPLSTRLPEDKAQIRKRELFDTFYRLAAEAERVGADAIIIAGDLFDRAEISKRRAERLFDIVRAHGEISFFYLGGNHENDGLLRSGAELPENLFVFGKDWTVFDFPELQIVGRTECLPRMFDSLPNNTDKPRIAVLHGTLGARSDKDGVIGLAEAALKKIDYLALGHYHSYSVTEADATRAVYSGTPEGRGFDEAFECGYVLLEVDGTITHSFHPFAKRQIRIVECDLSGIDSYSELESRLDSLLSVIPREDILRVRLVGALPPELFIDTASLTARYSPRCFYLEIKDETKQKINAEDYMYDKSFKGEFIRLVLKDTESSEEEKANIIKCGLSVLLGEELSL